MFPNFKAFPVDCPGPFYTVILIFFISAALGLQAASHGSGTGAAAAAADDDDYDYYYYDDDDDDDGMVMVFRVLLVAVACCSSVIADAVRILKILLARSYT